MIVGKLVGGLIKNQVKKIIKKKIGEKLNKVTKYVEEDNELDIQLRQAQKTISKQGRYIEEMEKDIANLKKDSHPPIFSKKDLVKLSKRINKLEKKCQTSKKK